MLIPKRNTTIGKRQTSPIIPTHCKSTIHRYRVWPLVEFFRSGHLLKMSPVWPDAKFGGHFHFSREYTVVSGVSESKFLSNQGNLERSQPVGRHYILTLAL